MLAIPIHLLHYLTDELTPCRFIFTYCTVKNFGEYYINYQFFSANFFNRGVSSHLFPPKFFTIWYIRCNVGNQDLHDMDDKDLLHTMLQPSHFYVIHKAAQKYKSIYHHRHIFSSELTTL